MTITNCEKFKGEIANYMKTGRQNIESKINNAFFSLKIRTWLCKTNISKREGYPASHVLFILILLPILKINSVKGFCNKQWEQWSTCKKDTFYRFKQNTSYRWRSFMYKLNIQIFKSLKLEKNTSKRTGFCD